MIVILFLLAAVFSLILAFIEAFLIKWLIPLTGIPYDPTYWQAFALAILTNVIISFSTTSSKIDTK